MTTEYLNLPGQCFVNQLNEDNYNDPQDPTLNDPIYFPKTGIQLKPELLTSFGFKPDTPTWLYITNGRIIITSDPAQCALINAIAELQLRQDEIDTDFTLAIQALAGELWVF